jgi:hypothetical protein
MGDIIDASSGSVESPETTFPLTELDVKAAA